MVLVTDAGRMEIEADAVEVGNQLPERLVGMGVVDVDLPTDHLSGELAGQRLERFGAAGAQAERPTVAQQQARYLIAHAR